MGTISRKRADRKYTWQDYLTWPDEERWEVIDGEAYDMTPSPSPRHQIIAGNFYAVLREKLKGKRCQPFIAPLDVYFDDYNFVQPDVLVVCDRSKIRDRVYGAPDLVVEVLSPATGLKDKREKKALYERFGVKEYIVIHPDEMLVERYWLEGERFQGSDVFGATERLGLKALEGIEVSLWEIFETEPPASHKEETTAG